MRRLALAAGTALVLFAASACSGDEDGQESANVIAPGAPGESASPATSEQIAALADEQGHNEADVTYLVKMIEHHTQALEMTDLVEDRFERDGIERIADRIAAAQDPEISAMESWLEVNIFAPARENPAHQNFCGLEGDGSHHAEDEDIPECLLEVDHDDMEGMVAEEDLERLTDAEGDDFDQLFVELMTEHHEGAVTMAEEAMAEAKDQEVLRMANDLIAEQNTEITRMANVLEGD
ncbi:DUF305 domain-containing protein [Nocardiopsis nanhaiensis]